MSSADENTEWNEKVAIEFCPAKYCGWRQMISTLEIEQLIVSPYKDYCPRCGTMTYRRFEKKVKTEKDVKDVVVEKEKA